MLIRFAHGRLYWLVLFLFSLVLMGTALYYQYGIGEPPCVLCIQVRVGVLGIALVASAGLLLAGQRWLDVLFHALTAALMSALIERSWQLLGTERGWIEGSCTMDAGLPDWLALDRWFPALFEVQVPCGYTPLLPFGVTMAEALLGVFVVGGLVGVSLLIAALVQRRGVS